MSGVVGTVGSAAESDMAASLSLDLQPSTGGGSGSGEGSSGFWTSVISSPTQEYSQSPTESVRDLLIQKRVSLTHTPDIVRVFQKDVQSQEQHEFQKVKNELKHVEDLGTLSARKYSQTSFVSSLTTRSNMTLHESSETASMAEASSESTTTTVESSSEATTTVEASYEITSAEENVINNDQLRRSNSKDLILELVPAPVIPPTANTDTDGSEKNGEGSSKSKSKKVVKKERSQTTMISDVLAKGRKETEQGKKSLKSGETDKKTSSSSGLQSTNLIKSVKTVNGEISNSIKTEKPKTVRSRSISPNKKLLNGSAEPKAKKNSSAK